MKSERRHELQQNDLAMYLDRINKSIEPYSRIIAVVVGAAFVLGIGWAFLNTQAVEKRSESTLQLIQASASQDAEVLMSVNEMYPDTAAGSWARLYQGQRYLSQGIQSLYNDRANAEELLDDAQAALKSAIAESDDTLLRSRAHFGIARAAESLGNLDEAIAAYNEVIAVNESEAMVTKAEERIETLSKPSTEAFLAWFGEQDFAPADPSLPPALPGGDTLPELPDLDLPELSLDLGDDDEMELKDGGLEMPANQPGEEGSDAADDSASTDDSDASDTAADESAEAEVTSDADENADAEESESADAEADSSDSEDVSDQ